MKRRVQLDLSIIPSVDWARLAAYIDGEGCIAIALGTRSRINPSRRVYFLEVTVTNTDVRLVAWLLLTFGGSSWVTKRQQAHWAPAATWNVASLQAAELLERCLPYFIIKREQAETALAFQRTILPGRPYGVKGRPQALLDHQLTLREQLQTLKGTSSRAKRPALASTVN